MRRIILPVPGVVLVVIAIVGIACAAFFIVRAIAVGDRAALHRYGREIAKVALWVGLFVLLGAILLATR